MSIRRRGDKEAIGWIAAGAVVFFAVVSLSLWLWVGKVQREQNQILQQSCEARRVLQIQHNRLVDLTRDLVATNAYTRNRLAEIGDPADRKVSAEVLGNLERLARQLYLVPLSSC